MPYDQVRDVLKNVRSFHKELAQTCEELAEQTDDERLQLLMDIVQKHEERFSTVLGQYESDTAEGVLNTWLQYAPTEEIQTALQSARLADANGIGEVAEKVWEFEQALIALYRQLAESISAPRVQELFQTLLEQEENKTGRYAWSLEEFQGSEIEGPPTEA
jgi:rubrerythrin